MNKGTLLSWLNGFVEELETMTARISSMREDVIATIKMVEDDRPPIPSSSLQIEEPLFAPEEWLAKSISASLVFDNMYSLKSIDDFKWPSISNTALVPTTITRLEMLTHPDPERFLNPQGCSEQTRGLTVHNLRGVDPRIVLPLSRLWYNVVGRDCMWYERNTQSDADLWSYYRDQKVDFLVLLDGHDLAGFAELDSRTPGRTELAYFGLFPVAKGKGYGRWFLEWITDHVWEHMNPNIFSVYTNTLDDPAALPNYVARGFQIVRQYDARYIDPRVIWPKHVMRFQLDSYPWPVTKEYRDVYESIAGFKP